MRARDAAAAPAAIASGRADERAARGGFAAKHRAASRAARGLRRAALRLACCVLHCAARILRVLRALQRRRVRTRRRSRMRCALSQRRARSLAIFRRLALPDFGMRKSAFVLRRSAEQRFDGLQRSQFDQWEFQQTVGRYFQARALRARAGCVSECAAARSCALIVYRLRRSTRSWW